MITIDVSKLEKLELDPTSFIYLYYRVQGITPIPDIIEKQANYELLDNLGYIKWINNGDIINIRPKAKAIFKDVANALDLDSWINEWRDIFPEGVKSGGRPVRGTKSGCIGKMKAFINRTGYSKSDIFYATKAYLAERKKDGYKFVICADYFISKDGNSVLEAYCEDMEGREFKDKTVDQWIADSEDSQFIDSV
jgi:hypothetical protein